MNRLKRFTDNSRSFLVAIMVTLFLSPYIAKAQKEIEVANTNLTLEVGGELKLDVFVTEDGKKTKDKVRIFSRDKKKLFVDSVGVARAFLPGKVNLLAFAAGVRHSFDIIINYPEITEIKINDVPEKVYRGTPVQFHYQVLDNAGLTRTDVQVELSSSNEEIATVDPFGYIASRKEGRVNITAKVNNIENTFSVNVVKNPVDNINLKVDYNQGRTGDVFHFTANAVKENGDVINDIPIRYSFDGKADDVSTSASGLIRQDGSFVADKAGIYTVTATAGVASAQKTLRITPRDVERKIVTVGQGTVSEKFTSDLWVWEGQDGGDYAVTGTWSADGTAYFWDVSDPANILRIDSIQVDARTVNDVKVSEDGKVTVISREGASNRKNGLVILDTSNPRDVKIHATYNNNLTGGVHNVFIDKGYIYALSAGQKYYVIDIKDPKNPKTVGKFELDTPGHSIHDVWVKDGIAYSSNWSDGIQLVDVGNGIAGGSPENPVQFASYAYPSGDNHAAFPFKSKSTGKFYVIGGDEVFPYGENGSYLAGGYLHMIDFTDLDNPEEVARFELPFAGSHNFWVDEESETLYATFYNGGVRVIDISGELMGDLLAQGRQITFFMPGDPEGYIPNMPQTWGAQLHKGHLFYSDMHSGLWVSKVEPPKTENIKIERK
ncbi:LVIVD repeat-containing protein [Roseivirga sp.]|uniref:LVIVD repeat-containing protein n=1 Tax=Roseivirga sp. TaxID=1964215 RepID=UPI003B8C3BCD